MSLHGRPWGMPLSLWIIVHLAPLSVGALVEFVYSGKRVVYRVSKAAMLDMSRQWGGFFLIGVVRTIVTGLHDSGRAGIALGRDVDPASVDGAFGKSLLWSRGNLHTLWMVGSKRVWRHYIVSKAFLIVSVLMNTDLIGHVTGMRA